MNNATHVQLDFEVITEGLLFPEGPVALPDGSVVCVDMLAGTLVRIRDAQIEVVARLGGGPNGAALGPDGKIYICNNGGFAWSRDEQGRITIGREAPASYDGGWIERVALDTGKVERVFDSCNGNRLAAPNDLVFDRTGGFWFTDTGKTFARTRTISGIYYAAPGCTTLTESVFDGVSFNGVGLSPEERILYAADTLTAALWAYELSAPGVIDPQKPGRIVARMPGGACLDSLAVLQNGDVCLGVLYDGGIAQISPTGTIARYALPDLYVTNICFGGHDRRDAFITLSETGRLIKTRWPAAGLKLNFG